MALIQVSPASAQVEGVTRNSVLERFLRETGLGVYGVVTAGTDAITSINDTTNLKSSQFTTSDWVGGWGRIGKRALGVASPENEHQPITAYDPTTNGRITVNPAFGTAPTTGDRYQLWKYPNPNLVKDFLDQALQNDIYLPTWSILSEIPDYDMEQNNTTDWTAVNATVTKVTNTEPEGIGFGKRKLSVVTTSANGYARTATFKVEPDKTYFCAATALPSAASTTAKLIAWDITNGAEIISQTTVRQYPTMIQFNVQVPSTCYQIQLRLSNVENTVTSYWDDVVFYGINDYDIALPWWVKDDVQVLGVFGADLAQIDTNLYDPILQGNPTSEYDSRDSSFGRGQLRLVHRRKAGFSKPLFIFGIRNEVAFADDNTDVKRINDDLIFSALAMRVFGYLKQQPNSGVLDTTWVRQQFNDYSKEYNENMRNQAKRMDDVIRTYVGDGLHFDNRYRFGF